jgi:hypothetical protein
VNDDREWFWMLFDAATESYGYSYCNPDDGLVNSVNGGDEGFTRANIQRDDDGTYGTAIWTSSAPGRDEPDVVTGFASLSDVKKYVEVMVRLDEFRINKP